MMLRQSFPAIGDTVRSILKAVMTNKLMYEYNLQGVHGCRQLPVPFVDLILCKFFYDIKIRLYGVSIKYLYTF